LVVRDEDELRMLRHLADHLGEAADVRVVERRVDLVENAERRRIDEEQREDQADGDQRLLAARQQGDAVEALARRTNDDLDAGLQQIVLVGEHELALTAAEQARENLLERLVGARERLGEARARGAVELLDRALE